MNELTQGEALKVVETDTLKVKVAELPTVDLSRRYMIQILEPITLIPQEVRLSLNFASDKGTINAALEKTLLGEWDSLVKEYATPDVPEWMRQVNKVDIIECDLLVPKQQS